MRRLGNPLCVQGKNGFNAGSVKFLATYRLSVQTIRGGRKIFFNSTLNDEDSDSSSEAGEDGGNNFLDLSVTDEDSPSEENTGKIALDPSQCSNDFTSHGSGQLSDKFLLHAYEVIMSQTGST